MLGKTRGDSIAICFKSNFPIENQTLLVRDGTILLQYVVPDTYPLMVLDGKGDAYMNMENFHGRNWRAIMVFTSDISDS